MLTDQKFTLTNDKCFELARLFDAADKNKETILEFKRRLNKYFLYSPDTGYYHCVFDPSIVYRWDEYDGAKYFYWGKLEDGWEKLPLSVLWDGRIKINHLLPYHYHTCAHAVAYVESVYCDMYGEMKQ